MILDENFHSRFWENVIDFSISYYKKCWNLSSYSFSTDVLLDEQKKYTKGLRWQISAFFAIWKFRNLWLVIVFSVWLFNGYKQISQLLGCVSVTLTRSKFYKEVRQLSFENCQGRSCEKRKPKNSFPRDEKTHFPRVEGGS